MSQVSDNVMLDARYWMLARGPGQYPASRNQHLPHGFPDTPGREQTESRAEAPVSALTPVQGYRGGFGNSQVTHVPQPSP